MTPVAFALQSDDMLEVGEDKVEEVEIAAKNDSVNKLLVC